MAYTKNLNYDAVIIGGGAAGLFAAGMAAGRGLKILLLEINDRLGVKLRITGKGRCNLTNDCAAAEVIKNTPTGGRFLYSALDAFSPRATMCYFENLGVPLKTERGNRVFPVSDKASDIVAALLRKAKAGGVTIQKSAAKSIEVSGGCVTGVVTTDRVIKCRSVILSTGGVSYPATGSTGDGYKMAAELGHTVIPPKPSLVPLRAEPALCSRMQGLALKNIRLTVTGSGKKPVFSDFGEMLFTHFGVSGPLILSASAHMRDFEREKYILSIDLKPALDIKKLDARILRDFDRYANRDFQNALGQLAPSTLIPVLVERSGIRPETKVNAVTREERRRLLELFKDFRIDVDGPRPVEEAIITSGGVKTKEINPKTMQSKLIEGLYFAGEIIDVDAYTGGFNLQVAWSTACAAANNLPADDSTVTPEAY